MFDHYLIKPTVCHCLPEKISQSAARGVPCDFPFHYASRQAVPSSISKHSSSYLEPIRKRGLAPNSTYLTLPKTVAVRCLSPFSDRLLCIVPNKNNHTNILSTTNSPNSPKSRNPKIPKSPTPSLRALRGERTAFTLLELILALSLTVVVLLIVGAGVTVQLKAFNSSRGQVEQAQLARVLLHRMADDLRAVSPPAADQSASSGSTSTDSSEPSKGNADAADETSSGSTGNQSNPTDSAQVDLGDAASTTPPPAGVYGDLDTLRVDVVRAIRREPSSSDADGSAASQPAAKIQTVVYYVVPANFPAAPTTNPTQEQNQEKPAGGLVRRELASPASSWAAQRGELNYEDSSVEPLSSAVTAVEFRYYDGSTWQESWDTETTGTLPRAVEIRLFLAPVQSSGESSASNATTTAAQDASTDAEYRLIVPLPFESAANASATTEESSIESPSTDSSESGNDTAPSGGDQP